MQRYFGSIIGNDVLLGPDDEYHILKVMRMRVGEDIEVVSDGQVFLCNIQNLKPLKILCIKEIKEKHELPNDVTLVASLLKGDKMDMVLQKATELGVSEIVLLSTERTIVKKRDFDTSQKLQRYSRILKEAAEQSKRSRIPELTRLITMKELKSVKADVKLIAYEGNAGSTKELLSVLKGIEKKQKVAVVIGPEGGFTKEEIKLAANAGFKCISLGSRILRAETACICALSLIQAYLERK